MNRVDFGKLVASLRKEHEDEEGRPWSQKRFAQEANLALGADIFSQRIVGSLERGERALDGETLLALATALKLTSAERKEFFLAACGIENEEITRRDNDPEEVLCRLLDTLKHVHLPACVLDPYYDIVAANYAAIDLLRLESAGLRPGAQSTVPFPHNLMRLSFSDKAADSLGRLMGEDWSGYACAMMMDFRAFSLRYRHTAYFGSLLKELMKYRLFKRYWREVHLEEKDHIATSNLDLCFRSPEWGHLEFSTAEFTAVTAAGDLHLIVYTPASRDTANTLWLTMGHHAGGNAFRLDSSWPEKTLP